MTTSKKNDLFKTKILFVDEQLKTVKPFMDELIYAKHVPEDNIKQVYSLKDALDFLKKEENIVDLVLIDLNIAPVPPELLEWRTKYFKSLELNHGQVLGMWLSEQNKNRPKKIAYAYLSAHTEQLDRLAHPSQQDPALLSKHFPVEKFPARLMEILEQF